MNRGSAQTKAGTTPVGSGQTIVMFEALRRDNLVLNYRLPPANSGRSIPVIKLSEPSYRHVRTTAHDGTLQGLSLPAGALPLTVEMIKALIPKQGVPVKDFWLFNRLDLDEHNVKAYRSMLEKATIVRGDRLYRKLHGFNITLTSAETHIKEQPRHPTSSTIGFFTATHRLYSPQGIPSLSFDELARLVDKMYIVAVPQQVLRTPLLNTTISADEAFHAHIQAAFYRQQSTDPDRDCRGLREARAFEKAVSELCTCRNPTCGAAFILLAQYFSHNLRLEDAFDHLLGSTDVKTHCLNAELRGAQDQLIDFAVRIAEFEVEKSDAVREVEDKLEPAMLQLRELNERFVQNASRAEQKVVLASAEVKAAKSLMAQLQREIVGNHQASLVSEKAYMSEIAGLEEKYRKAVRETMVVHAAKERAEKAMAEEQALTGEKLAKEVAEKVATELQGSPLQPEEPADPKFSRLKNKLLENENAELRRFRSRVTQAERDHAELVTLRALKSEHEHKAKGYDGIASELESQIKMVNHFRQENTNLKKKSTAQAEVSDLKDKLHTANIKIEELSKAGKSTGDATIDAYHALDTDSDHRSDDDTSAEASRLNLNKFQLSSSNSMSISHTYTQESVRFLKYLSRLQTEVMNRTDKIKETRGGNGWNAYQQLEDLMKFSGKETMRASRLVLSLDRSVKMDSKVFTLLGGAKGRTES